MERLLTIIIFVVLLGGFGYLSAVVTEQQRSIDALVSDQANTLRLQEKMSRDIQTLRQMMQRME